MTRPPLPPSLTPASAAPHVARGQRSPAAAGVADKDMTQDKMRFRALLRARDAKAKDAKNPQGAKDAPARDSFPKDAPPAEGAPRERPSREGLVGREPRSQSESPAHQENPPSGEVAPIETRGRERKNEGYETGGAAALEEAELIAAQTQAPHMEGAKSAEGAPAPAPAPSSQHLAEYVQKACSRVLFARGDGADQVSMRLTLSDEMLPDTTLTVSRAPDGAVRMNFETMSPESQNLLQRHAAALTRHVETRTGLAVQVDLQGAPAERSSSSNPDSDPHREKRGGWERAEWRGRTVMKRL